MRVFAFDHRMQFEEIADTVGADYTRIGPFKQLCLAAAREVSEGNSGYGILCDSRLGQDALFDAMNKGLWTARPVEWPGSRPLTLEPDIGSDFGGLNEWPTEHVVKVLCFYHPDDADDIKTAQEETIQRLFASARRNKLEFLLEVIPSKVGKCDNETTAKIIQRFYDIGVYPDWWKLEPMKNHTSWQQTCEAVQKNDPYCRGIVVLGLDAPIADLKSSFDAAAKHNLVKGFAVGRTIFSDTARAWLSGAISDREAIDQMAQKYRELCGIWDAARIGANK